MKMVIDTDVIVSSIRSTKGASAELVRLARLEHFTIAISVPLVLEYEAKATMEEHLAAGSITRREALAVVDALVAVGERTPAYFTYRPSVRDPDDEMILETAINAHADAIVTFNVRDFGNAPAKFAFECWSPLQALEKLR
ncbi:MAG: putative toxin-antitoxin system toxin component, PIN family [Novosphingobium sp.]|nr:putative toxin-antitoxin system toxin component, PIN family [Novosphingobium sp.]MBO9601695.1 putative toxin-antitoxin system toxin component, PIN family [Novosphingobium sp.]